MRFSANSPYMCCKELALEGEHSSLTVKRSDGYTMLMRSSKSETAVHGRHCPGDVAVRMHEVLAGRCTCFFVRDTYFKVCLLNRAAI